MSFTAALCYDFEVLFRSTRPLARKFSSGFLNFDSYQANRLHCRYRRAEDKKIELCHTLNGSALALPRIVAALLENFQTPEGIRIPKALQPYMGCEMIKIIQSAVFRRFVHRFLSKAHTEATQTPRQKLQPP